MNPNKYFQIMEETGNYTYSIINKYIDEELKEHNLKKFIKNFIEGRLQNKRRLRSMLIRAAYHILLTNNKGWKKARNLYAFSELWCIADYLTNDIFDGKLDKCKTEILKDPNLFFMASAIVRELAQKALQNAFDDFSASFETRVKVLEKFSELVKDAYLHQWIDYTAKYNRQIIDWLKENIEELFKKRYSDYQAGNVFGSILEICCLTINPKKENERKMLREFGIKLSIFFQLINDMADIVENCYDIKNKLLTFPIILTMIKTGKNVYNLSPPKIRELFINSGAFEEVRKKIIEERKRTRLLLKNLEQFVGKNNLGIKILGGLTAAAQSNKYYRYIKNLS